jgi:peptide/nickel transport system substrate-binding protein
MRAAGPIFLLAMLAGLAGPAYAQETGIPLERIDAAIRVELEDAANDIPNTAILLVYSDTEWTGSIISSNLGSSPAVGEGDGRIQFRCEGESGRFSASFQKQTDEGYLAIAAIQNGNLLNSTSTASPLGIANMTSLCNDAEEQTAAVRDSACLIATAAFGSELAPQVQHMRGFRDDHILSTSAGRSFMTAFNTVYYSFSPQVADYERDQPWLQQAIRVAVYPLLGILTVSEKAYSAAGGEHGAVMAGLAASSMIGAVYIAPLAFSVRQVREIRQNYRVLALVAAGASAALALSIYTGNFEAMMVTTSVFVLSVALISAILVAGILARVLKR